MRLLASFVVLALAAAAPAAEPAKAPDVPTAVKNALSYLDEYGSNWMESRKCASCHHLPWTFWVFNEAKSAGYKVDEKSLADITGFLTAADNRAKLFTDPNDKRPEAKQLSGGIVYTLCALGAAKPTDKAVGELQAKRIQHVLERQEKDGSW